MKDRAAVNMALIAIPASIMVSALTFVIFVSNKMTAVARRLNRNAQTVVAYGLSIDMYDVTLGPA
jgi:hypothetical protein